MSISPTRAGALEAVAAGRVSKRYAEDSVKPCWLVDGVPTPSAYPFLWLTSRGAIVARPVHAHEAVVGITAQGQGMRAHRWPS